MAQSGFAPSAGTDSAPVAQAENGEQAAQPAQPAVPATIEDLFGQLEETAREQLVDSPDLTNRMMSASVRKRLVRERIDQLAKEKFGDDVVKFLGENKWAYDQLHEKMRNDVEDYLADGLTKTVDSTMDSYIDKACVPLGEDHEKAFSEGKYFVTWVDCLIRELLVVASPTTVSPHSIVFELLNGSEAFVAKGVKLSFNWRNSAAASVEGMVRTNNMIVHNFPWVGREALVIPEDASTEDKDLIKGRRRIYAMSVLSKLVSVLQPSG